MAQTGRRPQDGDFAEPASRKRLEAVAEALRANGFNVLIADDPLSSVVLGAGKMLDDFDLLRRVALE